MKHRIIEIRTVVVNPIILIMETTVNNATILAKNAKIGLITVLNVYLILIELMPLLASVKKTIKIMELTVKVKLIYYIPFKQSNI